ncbi:putative salicylate hydroxylase [Cladophialophora carrionii]|uniref:Putative salicylate hydroxylase n=1 Tax=Cladophialophora carrionii TaxID=86049 RepID=A0A1C1CN04_9EURO|nr:putative salicylate hydroxylase [Cladophialophora carrionii]
MAVLQVGICGAGVAGLAAAIALRRLGHDVEVFERSQFKNENGAAVSITPNGTRVLQHWGFDCVKAGGIENIQVRRPKGDTLEPMAPTLNFANAEQLYGNKWFFYHRVDMHRRLREQAEEAGSIIRLGNQVMDVDPDTGVISLKDGTTVQKDLVVIADGQHDRLNAKITGKVIPMKRSGQTAYRCLIPMKDILADDETKFFFENQAPGFWAPALPAKGVMAVTYPCRNNEILNVLAVHRKLGQHATSEDDVVIEDWNFPATHEELAQVLDGFHPAVKKMFLKSPEVKVYTQMKRDPLNKMTRGKAVLVGDACHPMLLTHAQGVSSSIEDAAALELFLADVPATGDVSSPPSQKLLQRLAQFEAFRLPRVSATQILTDPVVPGPQAAANYAKQEAEIRKYYSGPLPPVGSMPHSPPICQFFFGYDVRKEAMKFLAEIDGNKVVNTHAPVPVAPTAPVAAPSPAAASSPVAAPTPSTALAPVARPAIPRKKSSEILSPSRSQFPVQATPVPVQKGTNDYDATAIAAAVVREMRNVDSLEQKVFDLERRLADMETKFAGMTVQIAFSEVSPTPPKSPSTPCESTKAPLTAP